MNIAIAGATGFVGRPLVQSWLDQGHDVLVIGRDSEKIHTTFQGKVKVLTWDGLKTPQGRELVSRVDVVVNLAGASIADHRWTEAYKQQILQSRMKATGALAGVLSEIKDKKISLLNASAVGIYGTQPPVGEDLPPGYTEDFVHFSQREPGFLPQVCDAWESAVKPAKDAGHRVVIMRFGVILGRNGGALQKMALPFWLFAGGPIGSGEQALPWVSREDVIRAINFLIKHQEIQGPVNVVAPLCLTQGEFAKILGKVIHRPGFIPTPGFILKFVLGEMADELLLKGQHVIPQKLRKAGFIFEHADVETALRCIYQ